MILDDMATSALDASVCAEAEGRAFELVLRFPNEICEAAFLIQRAMWQRRSIPAAVIEQLECVVRVRALGKAERETGARGKPSNAQGATTQQKEPLPRGETRPLYPTFPAAGKVRAS